MKTQIEIDNMLSRVEGDKRLYYGTAIIQINAPLALIQLVLETQSNTIRDILGLPRRDFVRERKVLKGKKK